MDELSGWYHFDPRLIVLAPIVIVGITHILPYLADRYGLRSYPGPLLGKVSSLWFAGELIRARNNLTLHALHEKYGQWFICIDII